MERRRGGGEGGGAHAAVGASRRGDGRGGDRSLDRGGQGGGRGGGGGGRGRGIKRVGLGVADQLLYSASNFAMTVLVARETSIQGFGAYSLVYASYLILTVIARGLTSETLVIRYSGSERSEWLPAARNAAGTSLGIGVVGGIGFLVVGLLVNGSFSGAAIVVGLSLPGLAVQDHLRYSALSRGRPSAALANDGVQVIVQFAVAGVLLAMSHATTPTLLAAWGIGAYLGAFVGIGLLKVVPNPFGIRPWFRKNRDLAFRYALDNAGAQAGQNGVNFVLAGVVGLSGPGALRGAQTVFSPPSILGMGIQAGTMPELVRTLRRSSRAMTRIALWIGLSLAALGAVWGGLAMLTPTGLGKALFGPTWPLVEPLIVYFLINQAASGLRMTPLMGLRALGAANRTLVARLFTISIALVTQVAGAVLDGVRGVAIANAVAGPLQVLAYWSQYRLALADHRREVGVRRTREAWDQLVDSVPEERVPEFVLYARDEV